MNAALHWIETHPVVFGLIVWPLFTAIVTSIFSKPSDEFAAKYPRLAALRRIPSDAGINLPKLMGNVLVMLTGGRAAPVAVDDRPTPKEEFPPEDATKKEGRGVPPLPVIFMLLAFSMLGCGPAKSADGVAVNPARETARAIVLLVTEGARSADELCAASGAAAKDAKTLKVCADAYSVARPALLSAAAHIDTWEGIEKKDVACAVGSAVRALDGAVQAMVAAGVKVPALISDAIKLGAAFAGGSCS